VKASDFGPGLHGRSSQFSMVGRWDVMARDLKEVGDRIVDGNEALKLSR